MASFCSNCGFPLGASNAFCPKCGARMTTQPVQPAPAPPPMAAAPPPQYAQPAPPQYAAPQYTPAAVPAKGGSALKILAVVFCVFAALAIAAVAGVIYVGHRVKQAVVSTAKTYGVDLPSAANSASSDSASLAPRRKPCDYLSKEEVSKIIGQPIERAVPSDNACEYFGPPGLAAKLGKEGISNGMNQLQGGDKIPNAQLAQGLNNLINGIGAQRGQEMPLLMITVDFDAKGQEAALEAAGAIFGGIPGTQKQEIPGLGDRAIRQANLGLSVMKGSTVIRVLAGPIPDPDNKTVQIAKAILPLV